ncbi:MAG: tRNA dihydrouridine synthase DusB [Planctomycetota bacterium]
MPQRDPDPPRRPVRDAPRRLGRPLVLGKDLVVDPPLFLAPMAGFTNLAFRRIVKRLGCGFTTTEMLMAAGVVRDHAKTLALARLAEEERPAGVQIAGGEPALLAEAAARLVRRGADLVDINMGCPVRKIVGRGAGAAMLRDPGLAARAVEAVVGRVPVPVTVKIRAGWDDATQAVRVARAVEEAGATAVTVHGRTREQQYRGRSDLLAIRAVKESVSIPVIGNGDIVRAEDTLAMIEATGVDGVMIGRAALRDPWIFQSSAAALCGTSCEPPGAADRRALLLAWFEETVALQGERKTVLQFRRFSTTYLRGFPGARRLRRRMQHLETTEDVYAVIDAVFEEGAPAPRIPDH